MEDTPKRIVRGLGMFFIFFIAGIYAVASFFAWVLGVPGAGSPRKWYIAGTILLAVNIVGLFGALWLASVRKVALGLLFVIAAVPALFGTLYAFTK